MTAPELLCMCGVDHSVSVVPVLLAVLLVALVVGIWTDGGSR
jgi:hypothetical protein